MSDDVFDRWKDGSPAHDAKLAANGEALVLGPKGGQTDEASLQAFQSIALDVLQAESQGEIVIITSNQNTSGSRSMYDSFIIQRV